MDRCPTCKRAFKRSNDQNAIYWALLNLMAEREWAGKRYSKESFHLYYRGKYLGCDDVTLPNGTTVTIPKSTKMDADKFSAYFDQVQADCAERGVFLADLETA